MSGWYSIRVSAQVDLRPAISHPMVIDLLSVSIPIRDIISEID